MQVAGSVAFPVPLPIVSLWACCAKQKRSTQGSGMQVGSRCSRSSADCAHGPEAGMLQNPDAFVHRVGRSARMGRKGQAVVFLAPSEQTYTKFLRLRKVRCLILSHAPLPTPALAFVTAHSCHSLHTGSASLAPPQDEEDGSTPG